MDPQIAVWLRSLIKHFIVTGQRHFQGISIWNFKKYLHSRHWWTTPLDILQDPDEALTESYRGYHKQLLHDMLDFRVSHSFSYDPTVQHAIFSYFHDHLVDEKSITGRFTNACSVHSAKLCF